MSTPTYDYPTAFSSWRPGDGGAEDAAIRRVLESGYLTMGPEVAKFEEEFANFHARRYAVMVNSGSSANLVAVAALAHASGAYLGPKNLNLFTAPAVAWSTTYAPPIQHGLYPRLIDVDPDTWNAPPFPPLGIEYRLHVVASILGSPAELAGTREFVDAPVLEDNCESLGARTADGRLTGTFGDLSTFSFFYSHQLSAIEGGMILTDDDNLAYLCALLRNHGNAGFAIPTEEFDSSYNFKVFGYNVRPLELHAAVAREQLRRLDELNVHRRANHDHFATLVRDLPLRPQVMTGTPAPFGLSFTLDDPSRRQPLVTALRAASIDCRLPTGGSFTRHAYGRPWADQPSPNADAIHDAGLFLGNAPFPIHHLIDRAVAVLREAL